MHACQGVGSLAIPLNSPASHFSPGNASPSGSMSARWCPRTRYARIRRYKPNHKYNEVLNILGQRRILHPNAWNVGCWDAKYISNHDVSYSYFAKKGRGGDVIIHDLTNLQRKVVQDRLGRNTTYPAFNCKGSRHGDHIPGVVFAECICPGAVHARRVLHPRLVHGFGIRLRCTDTDTSSHGTRATKHEGENMPESDTVVRQNTALHSSQPAGSADVMHASAGSPCVSACEL